MSAPIGEKAPINTPKASSSTVSIPDGAQPDGDRGAAGAGRNRMRCHGENERLCHGTDRAPVPDWLIKMMKVSLEAINKWGAVQIGEAPLVALRDVTFSITLFIALSFPKQVKKAGEKREKR